MLCAQAWPYRFTPKICESLQSRALSRGPTSRTSKAGCPGRTIRPGRAGNVPSRGRAGKSMLDIQIGGNCTKVWAGGPIVALATSFSWTVMVPL